MPAPLPFAAALALGLAGATLSAQSAPSAPASRPSPPTDPKAARIADRLTRVVDEIVTHVETHSGLEFTTRPTVRGTTPAEWREIVKDAFALESPRDVFEQSIETLGLYLAESDEVVLSPLVVRPLTRDPAKKPSKRAAEALAHHKMTVAHELVHALQQLHYGLPRMLEASSETEDTLRLKYLIEGHAVLVEERIAEQEFGLEDFFERSTYAAALVTDASYATGRRYFLHVLRDEGMTGVLAKLAEPPSFDEIRASARRSLSDVVDGRETTASAPTSRPADKRD